MFDPRSPSRDLSPAVRGHISAQRVDSGSSVSMKGRINMAGYAGQRTFMFIPHSFFKKVKDVCCCGNSKKLRNFKRINLDENKERQSLLSSEYLYGKTLMSNFFKQMLLL